MLLLDVLLAMVIFDTVSVYIYCNKQAISNTQQPKIISYIFPLHNLMYVLLEIVCKMYSSISFLEQPNVINLAVGYIIIVMLLC